MRFIFFKRGQVEGREGLGTAGNGKKKGSSDNGKVLIGTPRGQSSSSRSPQNSPYPRLKRSRNQQPLSPFYHLSFPALSRPSAIFFIPITHTGFPTHTANLHVCVWRFFFLPASAVFPSVQKITHGGLQNFLKKLVFDNWKCWPSHQLMIQSDARRDLVRLPSSEFLFSGSG